MGARWFAIQWRIRQIQYPAMLLMIWITCSIRGLCGFVSGTCGGGGGGGGGGCYYKAEASE